MLRQTMMMALRIRRALAAAPRRGISSGGVVCSAEVRAALESEDDHDARLTAAHGETWRLILSSAAATEELKGELRVCEERLAAAKRDIQEGVQGLVEDTEQLLEAVGDKVAAKMEEAAADVEGIRADLRGRLGGVGPGRSWSVSSFSFPALLGDSRKPSLACSVPGLELALVPAPVESHPINV